MRLIPKVDINNITRKPGAKFHSTASRNALHVSFLHIWHQGSNTKQMLKCEYFDLLYEIKHPAFKPAGPRAESEGQRQKGENKIF